MEYARYKTLYPDGPDESAFDRLRWEARRIMDRATTGLDGVRKLAVAPPVREDDAEAVERCEAALPHLRRQPDLALHGQRPFHRHIGDEGHGLAGLLPAVPGQCAGPLPAELDRTLWQTEQAEGCVSRADGTVTGKVVTAVTAGSESVSFAAPAAASGEDREIRCREIVERYLSGAADANGVNLLYMGRYPR